MGGVGVGVVEDEAERGGPAEGGRRPGGHDVDTLRAGLQVVGEEAEVRQIAGAGDALRDQPLDLGRLEREEPAERQPVRQIDAEVVGGQGEGAALGHGADAEVDGALGREGTAAAQPRDGGGRGNGAVVDQVVEREHVLGRDVERVLLARGRRPEPGAEAAAQGDAPGEGDPGRELAVQGRAEVREMLVAGGGPDHPVARGAAELEVAVHRGVGAVPRAGRDGTEPRRPVGADAEALRGVGALLPGLRLPEPDPELLVPPFDAAGDVDAVVQRPAQVEVDADLPLPVEAGVERRGRLGAERGVDGVAHGEVGGVRPGADARVPQDPARELPAQAPDHRGVLREAAEARREPAREPLLEREAVGVVEDRAEGGRIGHVAGDRHRGAARRAFAACGRHVADEQGAAAVAAEHPAAGVRVPEVEERQHVAARVAGVAVGLHAVGEQVAEVGEELEVVVDLRRPPLLGGVADVAVPGRDEARRVGPLHAAVGRRGVAVLEAEVGEAVPAQRQAGVGGDGVLPAVAGAVRPAAHLDAPARAVVPEQEVEHPGDGVRPVLGRRPVAQHLDLPQGDAGNGRDVGPLRAVGHAVAQPRDDRPAVAPLPVHEHQRVVGGHAPQARGADDGGHVPVLLRVDVEGREQHPQLVGEIGAALADDLGGGDDVDRHRRLGDRPRLGAAADDDDVLDELRRRRGFRVVPL